MGHPHPLYGRAFTRPVTFGADSLESLPCTLRCHVLGSCLLLLVVVNCEYYACPAMLAFASACLTRRSAVQLMVVAPLKSERPTIRLGYTARGPSRSAFSQAPRKLLLVEFSREEHGYQNSWSRSGGGSNSIPGALPKQCSCF